MQKQPVLVGAAVTNAITAVVNFLVIASILSLTPEAVGALNLAVVAIVDVPVAFWTRARVTPSP